MNQSENISPCCEEGVEHPIFSVYNVDAERPKTVCAGCLLFEPGDQIFQQGSPVKGIFVIKSGILKVHTLGESGKDQIIRFAKKGDVLGFRTLLSGESFGVSATTLESCELCFFEKKVFLQMMEESDELRGRVLAEMSQELAQMVEALTGMAQRSVRSRLCSALIDLKGIYAESPINLSREDLANFVGTAPETVIRLLSEMKSESLISVKGRKITVIDQAAIEKMSLFS